MPKDWTADEILGLARSYQAACIIAAAADWDVFTIVASGPSDAGTISRRLGADPRATTILLDALVALELLHKDGGRYSVPPTVGRLLTSGTPGSVLPMARHQANCLRRWVQLAKVLQTGQPAPRRPSIRGEAADHAAFIGAMDNVSAPVAAQVVKDIGPPPFTHLLDVGGASGTWTIAFLRAMPIATATLFDLPPVIPLAEQRLRAAGLADRVRLVAGDFMIDALPTGADLAWVSAIVHQNSREQNRQLFSAVFKALDDGGAILIRDILMDASRTSPIAGALFAVNMLVGTEAGGTFTFEELQADLEAAGFGGSAVLREEDGMNSVIRADKPRSMGA